MPDKVQAKHKIRLAGVIALKPCTKVSQKELKLITPRGRYKNAVNTKAIKEPNTNDLLESQLANAS